MYNILQILLTDGVVPSSLKIFKRDKWDYGVWSGYRYAKPAPTGPLNS